MLIPMAEINFVEGFGVGEVMVMVMVMVMVWNLYSEFSYGLKRFTTLCGGL